MLKHFIDLSLLKNNRDFALLYAGQFISMLGTMITFVALPYQIYALTHSSMMVGLLSLVQLLPLLITALLGGVYADRYNRRILVIVSECCLALGCLWFAYNAFQAEPSLWGIFVLASLSSAITGLHRPAFEGMAQQLVAVEDYKSLGILASFKFSFCMIVGPAIAGLIIAHTNLGITYLIDAATFIVSLMALYGMKKTPNPAPDKTVKLLSSLKEGLQFAFSKESLKGSYFVDFLAMIFAMPNALFPAIAHSLGGAKTLGLLYAAPAVGALFISFFSGWTAGIYAYGRAIAISAMLWGVAIIGFGLSTASLPLALLFLALSGSFDAVSGIFRATLWNQVIPHEKRGRLAGIEMLSYLSGPRLGDTRAGFFSTFIGNTGALVSGGIICVLAVMACCWSLPKFWNYHSKH